MNVEELRYKITGAAMSVHRHFGPGYLEEVYKNALMIELKELGLECEKEVPIPVEYKGVRVGDYRADIIVEKCMILELKAVSALCAAHEAQLGTLDMTLGLEWKSPRDLLGGTRE